MTRKKKIAYGDFQTPKELAESVVAFLCTAGVSPSIIVEPTCGLGSFTLAASKWFRTALKIFAFDINAAYVSALQKTLRNAKDVRCHVSQEDFFSFNWKGFFKPFRGEILVLGNPPWVTNSALGALGSRNLPKKTNFQNHRGFAAKTGKANFDISEWMLIKLLESLNGQLGCVAMLCKTAIARKALKHGWLNHLNISRSSLHLIDASAYFGVSVDACLMVIHTGTRDSSPTADVYSDLSFNHKLTTFGLVGKELVADLEEYNRLKDLDGLAYYTWRSGVKHDAASVMEFKREGAAYVNGIGERIDLEQVCMYPLLKSSDLANGRLRPQRSVLITQHRPGDDTKAISKTAPKTWSYLLHHAKTLDQRSSIIYHKRARFSVFGVGDYTFSPWKVAVSGLYKNFKFQVINKHQNKPVVLDDTCYFIPCATQREASFVCSLLNSAIANRFIRSLVFFDAKRPITIDVLNRIDLKRIAEKLELENTARVYLRDAALFEKNQGLLVFEEESKYRTKSSLGRVAPHHR